MRLNRLLPALLLLCTAVALPACERNKVLHPEPAPAADPEFIQLDAAVAQRYVEADEAGQVTARLRLHIDGDLDLPRPPANVALVMDTSASMRGEAIDKARAAAATLLDSLQDGDMVSVVAFGSKAELIAPATVVSDASRTEIKKAIAAITDSGTTDLAGGLSMGIHELTKSRAAGGEQLNRIVLLSDGVPNDDSQLASLASTAASYQAPITALGLGIDFHETLLTELARSTGGRFEYIEEPTELAKMFREEMLDLDRIVAQNVYLSLTPGPDVGIVDVVGQPFSVNGRGVSVGLGNLLEGHEHDVIVQLQTTGHAAGATVELLDATLSFNYAGQSFTRDAFLSTNATDDAKEIAKGLDTKILLAAAKAHTAAATLKIIEKARSGLLEQAQADLAIAQDEASAAIERFDDPDLSQLAKDLDDLEDSLPELAPASNPPTGPLATPTPSPDGGPYAEPPPTVSMDEAPVTFDADMDDAHAPSSISSGRHKRQRARQNRRAHSRAYKALSPRMAQ